MSAAVVTVRVMTAAWACCGTRPGWLTGTYALVNLTTADLITRHALLLRRGAGQR
ncbi:hypothetical protein ACWCQL_33410 [Streptomyces sp. NPDC002073]